MNVLTICVWLAALSAEPATNAAAVLRAGGLSALPAEVPQDIPLANPGFEQQWEGWKPAEAQAFSIVSVEGTARSGQNCARLDCGEATRYSASLRQPLPEVGPGVYVLRFWIKSRDLGGQKKATSGARVSIEYLLADGTRSWPSTEVFRGTRDWTAEELKVVIPAEVKPGSVTISLHRYGGADGGEAWFDDLQLARVMPPPIEAFLLYPNYRGLLSDDGPGRIRLRIRVNDPSAAGPPVVEVFDGQQRSVASVSVPADLSKPLEIDAAGWPAGLYRVEARSGGYRYPAYVVNKIPAAVRNGMPVWFDADQALHLGGKPTFPIGLYNTTLRFYNRDDEVDHSAEAARLEKMAEAPINANINYWFWYPGMEARRRYLGAMAERGMWFLDTVNNVYPPFPSTPMAREIVPEAAGRETLDTQELVDRYQAGLAERMSELSNFLGWYAMDERGFDEVPRHFHQRQVLAEADPGHPIVGISNKPAELSFWRDTVDVLGMDPYPLMNMKAGRPLSLVGEWTRSTVDATDGSRPVWTVIQFFQGWSTDRWPTEDELRTMSLMAITEGARGLFYWSYGSRALKDVGDPEQREEYWQRLVRVTREIKSLEPALVAADAPGCVKAVSDPRVRWRARVAGGKCYVFCYLPADKFIEGHADAVDVRFELADGQTVERSLRPDSADWFGVDWTAP